MNRYQLAIIILTSICLNGCTTKSDESGSHEKSNVFERIHYQNESALPDLGVGLWAWPLPMDYDEDGDMDLVVSCRDVPFNGLWYFENKSGTQHPVFEPPVRIGEALKDIQVSYVEGKPRFLQPGYELTDIFNPTEENSIALFPADTFQVLHKKIRFNQWKYVDYENDGDLDILVGIQDGEDYGWDNAFDAHGIWTNGPLHGFVYLIENVEGRYILSHKIKAGGKAIDVYGSPSPNMEDFDNDGDLDLICGEFLDKLTWFENIGTREIPVFAEGKYLENSNGTITMDLEMIVPVALDWDRDGDIDLIVGDEDGRVAYVENTGTIKNNMPVFRDPEYFKQKPQYLKFGALSTPISVDWDNDGDDDLICGNSAGYIGFIENLDGGNPPSWAQPVYLHDPNGVIRIQAGYNGSIQGPCEAKWGYTTLNVDDWDDDGLNDIIVNSIWGKVIWYKNIGEKGRPELDHARQVKVDWENEIPYPEWNWWKPESGELATQWRTTPVVIDWNKDGITDLIMLDHEGYLSYFEGELKNDEKVLKPGKKIFISEPGEYDRRNNPVSEISGPLRLNTDKYGASGRRKLGFADWDGDGDLDLLVNSSNIALFENIGEEDGLVKMQFSGDLSDHKLAGHTTSPTIVDWDNNGIPDLLLGAEDGHFYYLKNPRKP